ncbi:hypothetical protein [Galbibacter sp.]|uniref:hypothetical protein n=1 Tax=Galbibacter sp. TaxID=2918471 RepID=UPI002CDB5965|nr:hypothetical protein [Galbibacter sp.]HLV62367.1 hypothetical protein [Galbibacter sp.]
MKKIGLIILAILVLGIGGYFLLNERTSWADSQTLEGYDSKAAAEQTPVESFDTPVPAVQQPVQSATGVNPPHGQPGHRCDIAVGAPLGGNTMLNNDASVTLNPAHGQPGHRCDIAVGAPLPNS